MSRKKHVEVPYKEIAAGAKMMVMDLLIGKRFGLFLKSEESVSILFIWESK